MSPAARQSIPGFRILRGATRKIGHGATNTITALARLLSPPFARIGPPRGTFSAYQRLKAGEYTGEVIREGQEIDPIAPDAMRIVSGLGQDRHQPWPIFWTRHTNARLGGETLVLLDEHKRACKEAMYEEHFPDDPAYRALTLPEPTHLTGQWTSVVSRWWCGPPSYYHWLMDALPRLALLDKLPSGIRVIVPPQLSAFQRDSLAWLGLEERYRPTSEHHLVVDDYFFSSPTVMTGCTNPYGVAFLREKFLGHSRMPNLHGKKIYIVRKGKTRGILNEDEVKKFLTERGWLIVDCETLTFAEQIGLFSQASQVCGAHGAGFTNILWCPAGCQVVELMADNFKNGCYEAISACLGLEHHCLVFPGDAGSRIPVDISRLERTLNLPRATGDPSS